MILKLKSSRAPLLADLFLYSYESEFLQKLVKDKKIHEARAFNFTYRYIDDMWNCSLTQQILSHSFYDWKPYELFLLSRFLICHAVGWYIELKNQKFW
jgi:hypothetical protein